MPVRCAIYSRVSTDEQTRRDYNSLETQLDICRHALAVKQLEGWVEDEHYSDGGYSGKNLDRPELQRLLAAVRAGHIGAIMVYKIDRITRSIADFYALWDELKKHDVVFVSATQSFDTSDPTGNLMLNMLLSFGQFERELTSERVRHKNLERAKRGLWNGGWVPTGYQYDKGAKTLAPEPDEAAIVKRIFSLTKKLKSPTAVGDALNELGLLTKTRTVTTRGGEKKEVGGKRWIADRVARIVRNPIYRGIIVHERIEYEGQHQALVSDNLWKEANQALQSIDSPARPHDARNKYELLLKGILRCDKCGNIMTPKPAGKKDPTGKPYVYYCCGDVAKEGSASGCDLRQLPSKPFEEFVVSTIGEFGRHPEIIASTLAATKKEGSKTIKPLRRKEAEIRQRYDAVSAELESCLGAITQFGEHKSLAEELATKAEKLAEQKRKIGVELEVVQMDIQRKQKLAVEEGHVTKALLQFEKVFELLPFEDREQLVRLLIREIRVSRFDPKKDESPADPSVFRTKIRTSWYRVAFQFYVTPSLPKELRNEGTSSYSGGNGGQGGIRTLGTIAGTLAFQASPFDHSGTCPWLISEMEWKSGNVSLKKVAGARDFCGCVARFRAYSARSFRKTQFSGCC